MAKKGAYPRPQGTLLLDDLEVGHIYRDALSGYLVLVKVAAIQVRNQTVGRLVGWMWNPVWGKHCEVELHDHQLISAGSDTDLMPDTRYKNGYHGL